MNKAIKSGVLTILAVCAFARAHAVPILDQQQLLTFNSSALIGQVAGTPLFTQGVGQTLTVGRSGLLTQVDFALARHGSTTAGITLRVVELFGGLPIGAERGSASVGLLEVPDVKGNSDDFLLTTFDFSAAGINVIAGEMIGLVLDYSGFHPDIYIAWGKAPNPYGGGQGLVNRSDSGWGAFSAADFGFRTFVDGGTVSEPATFGLLSLGVVGLFFRRLRSA